MRFFQIVKDGGPESHVWAYVLIESKRFGSIMLLRFENGTRDAFHSHAFNAVSWVVRGGGLLEWIRTSAHHLTYAFHAPSWRPVFTARETFHQVASIGRTWVLTFRGPWAPTWREQAAGEHVRTLTHGRREVERVPAPWEGLALS